MSLLSTLAGTVIFAKGFSSRYTDFIVNEVRKDGTVLHLSDYNLAEEPQSLNTPSTTNTNGVSGSAADQSHEPEVPAIAQEDLVLLEKLVGASTSSELTTLYNQPVKKEPASNNAATKIVFPPIVDKAERGLVHREIRRIFSGQIETQTDDNGVITATSAPKANRRSRGGGRQGGGRNPRGGRGANRDFSQLGGEYLHFTLYKENKDTMEVINNIARMLRIKSTNFNFAGTKDRRAATTQRVCVLRGRKESLDWLNGRMQGYKLGDYKYQPHPISLGDHGGNEFVIVVKDCVLRRAGGCSIERRVQMLQQAVSLGLANIKDNGFLNYFGLQRFGTHTIGTQEVGTMILTEDFERAVDALLYVDPDVASHAFSENEDEAGFTHDELARARAISVWKSSGNSIAALKHMPRRFSAESTIIHHLGKNPGGRRDFCGAILSITRGMRMLYIHAYQSCIWNFAASRRWERYGSRVVKGDLVFVDPNHSGDLAEDDNEASTIDSAEPSRDRARALTVEEAESGKYSIFDILLPLPGYDVMYPDNDIGAYYVELMGLPEHGCLDPYNMRRRQREFSLSGGYRKLMARFVGEASGTARAYRDDNEQMHPTDLDVIEERKGAEKKSGNNSPQQPTFDDAATDSRRRQRENDTNSPSDLRTSDTWVESTSQGTSKRLKVAQDFPSDGHMADANNHLNNPPVTGDLLSQARPVDNSASNLGAASIKPIRQPTVPLEDAVPGFTWPSTVPKTMEEHNAGWGVISVDSQFLRDLERSTKQRASDTFGQSHFSQPQDAYPQLGHTPFQASPLNQASLDQSGPHPEVLPQGQGEKDTRPELTQAPSSYLEQAPAKQTPSNKQPEALAMMADKPDFQRAPPKRSRVSAPPGVNELKEDMKLAVVLKFQLRSSNYATIFLRELMGTMDPDFSIEFPASPV
ncbi:putative trna pseudouridine synthase d protein [Phaeoacremonium minimum UCRPA7]|uniref:Putative trna pseudouridine synthase d protein n=1 Tax=Phaeoacremonium minimum (strain UCR-PA7) TaxID=1286976 RepID=R8BSH5_PHAM7|nr:putative trna pseudouridine synthase d protein [Phaeoacremonium minimum UCRPA7]EOO02250.1 putative trna pseudouridine synthase d protein [Phaeoacremonium minimum UCRPA7]